MALSKRQQRLLRAARARLDPRDPAFNASPAVRASLEAQNLKVYIETWVLPILDGLLRPPPRKYERDALDKLA